ncbi:TonB-dependent receptor plug domain-containing protein [Cellvibrio japonicus]|uniref:TonB-dependent outer membrane receptor n=1 Tax=Cellvibrio japonicus (strain Ueda107) TaxID=498211 RepID=B3PHN0_CELJU|nr:TonB-dependent receptor [Cellvibrio japonicus]ACE85739.1 TonB-dependent outer membrane receptor [Cellvibrio japonicus Ueda107]QEI12501.1 TonB-dependent receptor plug domain-containing protein [Cellvibrio japonicus]QEI16075.1 TonB-dependent receptor plug domain-containing protein [Cellvibrio japonicus]QEI19653.1 TonB-dependent receptor plug domain-containing protein [Cellvibrio japonicus]
MKQKMQTQHLKPAPLATVIATISALGISATVLANTGDPKLETIVVTANAQDTERDNTQRISIDTIRAHDKETVGSALNLSSGVSLSKIGARNEEMVYVRGFDLRQVPVFLDGIPVYVPYDGYVDLGRFNTFGIAHIDVAKGFSSLIYGPNTLGGAINLVSRKPGDLLEGEIGAGTTWADDGDNNSRRVYANIGSNQGGWYLQGGISYLDMDYFALPDDFPERRFEDGGKRENSYSDDRKYSLKLALTPNATDEYSLSYSSQQGEKGNPPYAGAIGTINARFWQWPTWDKDSLYLLSNTQWDRVSLKVRAYHDTYQNSLFTYDDATYTTQNRPSSFRSWYDDYTNGASAQLDFRLSERNLLKAAYHWKEDVHREYNAGEPVRRTSDRTQSVALEDTHNISDTLSLVAGVSHDWRESLEAEDYNANTGEISDFPKGDNSANNITLGVFYRLSDESRIHLTAARKHRFATIKDRFSYRMGSAIPNPELRSEAADHIELGYEYTLSTHLRWDISVFRSDISDMIQAISIPASACSSPPCSQMQNIGEVRATGVDTGVRLSLNHWELGAAYSYLERDNITSPSVHLIDTPRHKIAVDLRWNITDAWNLTATTEAASSRYTTSNGVQQTRGFGVTNLKTGYRILDEKLLIETGVRNAFDRLYEYSEGFPEAGRTWFLQMNYSL